MGSALLRTEATKLFRIVEPSIYPLPTRHHIILLNTDQTMWQGLVNF